MIHAAQTWSDKKRLLGFPGTARAYIRHTPTLAIPLQSIPRRRTQFSFWGKVIGFLFVDWSCSRVGRVLLFGDSYEKHANEWHFSRNTLWISGHKGTPFRYCGTSRWNCRLKIFTTQATSNILDKLASKSHFFASHSLGEDNSLHSQASNKFKIFAMEKT